MSAALVRWGATAGPQRSGRSEDGATGERQGAPGSADGPFAADAAAATLLARGAAADSPMAAALRQAEKGQVERERWQAEAKRRRAIAAAEAEAGAAPSEPAQSSPATPSRQPHGIGLGAALDLPVMPNSSGSSLPPSVTELPLTHPQKLERALRARAEADRHDALMEAIRETIARDDRQQLEEAYEVMRTFGLDPQTVASQSRLLRQILSGQGKALSDYDNKQRHDRLGTVGIAGNELEKQLLRWGSGNAIDSLNRFEYYDDHTRFIEKKIARGEPLTNYERTRWENRHVGNENVAKGRTAAFERLAWFQARLAQLPDSPALRKLVEANTVGSFLNALIDSPLELAAVGLGKFAPTIATGATGTLLAGPAGGIIAVGGATFGPAFADALIDGFRNQGVDLNDRTAVLALVRDRDKMRKIHNAALVAAGIATVAEMLSGGIASTPLTVVRRKVAGELIEMGAQMGAQGAVGAGQEATTALLVDGRLPTIAELRDGFGRGAAAAIFDRTISGAGAGLRSGVLHAGTKLQPYYQAFRDRNTPTRENVDYNRSISRFTTAAQDAQRAAKTLATGIRHERKLQSAVRDQQARKGELEESGVQQGTFYLSRDAANRLRKAGKLNDDLMMELGISRRWLDTVNTENLVAISRVDLLTSRHLRPEDVETFSQELRVKPDVMSARDAANYLQWRKTQLENISARFEAPTGPLPDGWTVYRYALGVELAKDSRNIEAARLKAAETAEYFINVAISRGADETADRLFRLEYPRLRP